MILFYYSDLEKACYFPSIVNGCETWTLHRTTQACQTAEELSHACPSSILGIRWLDRITNLEVLDRAECSCIEAIKTQLQWVGYVIRMDERRMPRQLLHGELEVGKRKQGRPRKQYKDTVTGNLQWCGIQPKELEAAASDRSHWRSLIHTASTSFEDDRRQRLMAACERRHRASSANITTTKFQCPICSRLCTPRLGLYM